MDKQGHETPRDNTSIMHLPNVEQAVIEEAKVRDYLMSSVHVVGRYKATWFRALGYEASDWQRLRRDLLTIAAASDARRREASLYGQKYEVRATLVGPSGKRGAVVSIWIVPTGTSVPRFVTDYPA